MLPSLFIKYVGVAASNTSMGAATTPPLATVAQRALMTHAAAAKATTLLYFREMIPISEYFITCLCYTYIFFYAKNIAF